MEKEKAVISEKLNANTETKNEKYILNYCDTEIEFDTKEQLESCVYSLYEVYTSYYDKMF